MKKVKKWTKITDEVAYEAQKLQSSKNKSEIAKILGIGYNSVAKALAKDVTKFVTDNSERLSKTRGQKAWETRKANIALKSINPVVIDKTKSIETEKKSIFTINYEGVNIHISESRVSDVYFGINEVRVVSK